MKYTIEDILEVADTVNAKFLPEKDFHHVLNNKADGYIVYHKALATRRANFDPTHHLKNRW